MLDIPVPLRAAVVLLAAGEGRRVGAGTNKVLLPLAGIPVFEWSLLTLTQVEYVDQLVVVVRPEDHDLVAAITRRHFPDAAVVIGGSSRHASEWNALQRMAQTIDAGAIDVVAIHDGARPLADAYLFREVLEVAAGQGGALPVRAQDALIPKVMATRDTGLVAVQTPQAFAAAPLLDAYRQAERDGFTGTDTASCVETYTDVVIRCVAAPATNMKVTFPEDVALAQQLIKQLAPQRI